MVHTQDGAHTREAVATLGVLSFKGSAGAGPRVERSELKRAFLATVSVRVRVSVTVTELVEPILVL